MFRLKSTLISTAGFFTIFGFFCTLALGGEVTRTGENGRTFTTQINRDYNPETDELNTTRVGQNGRSINSNYKFNRSNGQVDTVHTTGNGRVLRTTTRTIKQK